LSLTPIRKANKINPSDAKEYDPNLSKIELKKDNLKRQNPLENSDDDIL